MDTRHRIRDTLGWEIDAFRKDHHVINSCYGLIFVGLIAVSVILSRVIGTFSDPQTHVSKPKTLTLRVLTFLAGILPEAAISMTIGMIISLIIFLSSPPKGGGEDATSAVVAHSTDEDDVNLFDPTFLGFSPTIFFFVFLPPVIFSSGYFLRRRLFFRNIRGIFCLSVVGTFVSTCVVSSGLYFLPKIYPDILPTLATGRLTLLECVAFGSLISSTDPVSTLALFSSLRVDPTLFYLTFGESVLNDAISIVIFKVSSKFVSVGMSEEEVLVGFVNFCLLFVGSSILGYVFGILSALLFKYLPSLSSDPTVTVTLFLATVYVPFLLSEAVQLSGIVCILWTGKKFYMKCTHAYTHTKFEKLPNCDSFSRLVPDFLKNFLIFS